MPETVTGHIDQDTERGTVMIVVSGEVMSGCYRAHRIGKLRAGRRIIRVDIVTEAAEDVIAAWDQALRDAGE